MCTGRWLEEGRRHERAVELLGEEPLVIEQVTDVLRQPTIPILFEKVFFLTIPILLRRVLRAVMADTPVRLVAVDMLMDICADVLLGMCTDICIDMRMDMRIDMCI